MPDEQPFEGHPNRECGEHRTTGLRAWCFTCSEWCYPDAPCAGCERPMLREELRRFSAGRPPAGDEYPRLYALLDEVDG